MLLLLEVIPLLLLATSTGAKAPSTLCDANDDPVQCDSLCDLFRKTNMGLTGWANGSPLCTWPGVTCGSDKLMVTALDLSSRGLTGDIPESIGNLSELERLDVSNQTNPYGPNAFGTGGIPESIGRLSKLQRLDLSSNDFVGRIPDSIGQLSSLQFLHLDQNNPLGGSLPESIGQLSSLKSLRMSHTQLTGSIPDSLGKLSSLESLDLSHCELTGPVPASLGQLKALHALNLTGNSLSSWTSNSICSLIYQGELSDCSIYGNPLACPIPACAPACSATCTGQTMVV